MLAPVAQAETYSVQEHPEPGGAQLRFGGYFARGPILAAPGTRERQWQLRQYWHHDYNELFRSAAVGLIKKVQSTPYEIRADRDADRWQHLLMQADFGSWDRFVSKIVKSFLRYDSGAWIELIAPGPVLGAPTGPVVGLSVLDSLRVYPTGNPTYPAIYYDMRHRMHLLHRTRVVQFVDAEDDEESLRGYGESALSRAIGTVYREILMERYIEQFLDDRPPPGFMVTGNISPDEVEASIQTMLDDQSQDIAGPWGQVVRLNGLQAENEPIVKFISLTTAPEKFDYKTYTEIDVRKIAAALGMDLQEFWDLSGSGGLSGTGTQSEVLAQKSRGKALGRILKGLERVINQALPVAVEFAFQYKDPEEDREEAEKGTAWSNTVLSLVSSGAITNDEARQLLVNQVPAFQDALTDQDGQIRRLPDDDPKPEAPDVVVDEMPAAPSGLLSEVTVDAQKDLEAVARPWRSTFRAFVRAAQTQNIGVPLLRATYRDELHDAGEDAYFEGLRDGGLDPNDADAVTKADRRRAVAEWLAVQNPYINTFVDEVQRAPDPWPDSQIGYRADLWVNKSLRAAYFAGLHEAEGAKMKRWVWDPNKDHCQTCKLLNGQVHSLATWLKSGFTPGCTCLECGGYQCGCSFEDAQGGAVGRIPGQGIARTLVDRFADFLRTIGQVVRPGAGKSLEPVWADKATHSGALARFLQHQAVTHAV